MRNMSFICDRLLADIKGEQFVLVSDKQLLLSDTGWAQIAPRPRSMVAVLGSLTCPTASQPDFDGLAR